MLSVKPTVENLILHCATFFGGPECCSWCSDSLGTTRPEDRIPMQVRFFATVQTCPGTYPFSYTIGTRSFPVVKRPEVTLTSYPF